MKSLNFEEKNNTEIFILFNYIKQYISLDFFVSNLLKYTTYTTLYDLHIKLLIFLVFYPRLSDWFDKVLQFPFYFGSISSALLLITLHKTFPLFHHFQYPFVYYLINSFYSKHLPIALHI